MYLSNGSGSSGGEDNGGVIGREDMQEEEKENKYT